MSKKTKDTDRRVTDVDIRMHGFAIHARPQNSEPIWERAGVLYPESKVVKIIKELSNGE